MGAGDGQQHQPRGQPDGPGTVCEQRRPPQPQERHPGGVQRGPGVGAVEGGRVDEGSVCWQGG